MIHLPDFRAKLMLKRLDNDYYVSLQLSSNPINYKVANLEKMNSKYATVGLLSMKFKQPRHQLMFTSRRADLLGLFVQQVLNIPNSEEVNAGVLQVSVAVPSEGYVAVKCLDLDKLNTTNLNILALENCDLPDLSKKIGQLPLIYLSLSGSKLPTSPELRDTFWNWMSVDTIRYSLKTLKLDSISLDVIPFELMYLRNLHTLSVAHNKLTYLPHFFLKLQKLRSILVADNKLRYIPFTLIGIVYTQVDISDNPLTTSQASHQGKWRRMVNTNKINIRDNQSVTKLTHLCMHTLVRQVIPFKRQDIPRDLWDDFNMVGWCWHCHHLCQPDYSYTYYVLDNISSLETLDLIKNDTGDYMEYQFVVCHKCVPELLTAQEENN